MSDLTLVRGDARPFTLTTGVDLSASKVWFTAKYRRDDADSAAVWQKTNDPGGGIVVTDGIGGVCAVSLTSADWAAYTYRAGLYWDIQYTDSEGEPHTPLLGGIAVIEDVTRATT